jgi:hypothetical protein
VVGHLNGWSEVETRGGTPKHTWGGQTAWWEARMRVETSQYTAGAAEAVKRVPRLGNDAWVSWELEVSEEYAIGHTMHSNRVSGGQSTQWDTTMRGGRC